MSEKPNRDWNEIISKSNGALMFLPDNFTGAARDWREARGKYNSLVAEMAKKELMLNMAFQTLIFELRKHLEANGHPDIYLKDLGFETAALEDGKFVVAINEPQRGALPMK